MSYITREITFGVTEAEYVEISSYVKAKKRWRRNADFVRDCVFQAIARNPSGKHNPVRGGDATSSEE
jgi:hypothetical protein